MARLEDLKKDATVKGILPDRLVTIIDLKWHGNTVIELTYKDSAGNLGNELLFRDREPMLEIIKDGSPWNFDADGEMFRLTSEAYRISLAHLFDPYLAIHTSMVEPLPHQITAVYGEMLQRQPLRYLLADDPGAGKTIMTGLLIKELIIRGDLKRCLIVCPGNLAEQWQDELGSKFNLYFEILTNDRLESSRTGNVFLEMPLCIARLDKLSRNEDVQIKLKSTEWDLIVCDEAHKMSASFFGGEIKYTKRYKLGQLLSTITRDFLLLTATPHNGKEEDFQLFMALLDGDRFEGKFRDGVHTTDVSDLMRRLVKEELLKFDGTPLFPERIAYTVDYDLSDEEALLYKNVTEYVKEEFNRADKLDSEGRKGTIGFALTILQRRLASSPEAIYQSLRRRRERLEKRLNEEKLKKRGAFIEQNYYDLSQEDIEDLDEAPDKEVEDTEENVIDQATASRTISELEEEINKLKYLERMAYNVRNSGHDRKWEELSKLLQNNDKMFDAEHKREKLIIFTEQKDTLNYLAEKIRTLLGRNEAVVTIQGGMSREDRRKTQEIFTQDKEVRILVATDAAGEGINLQRAHLMINYDLPWNPNKLEQRFGRIHRICQTEVCHLWNLVASETREGEVFNRLLSKLEEERKALGGRVFDILGKVTFDNKSLKDLLIEAIRYGDRPDVKARLNKVVDNSLDRDYLRKLLDEHALAKDTMDITKVMEIKEDMERMEARKLQPHFVESFFIEAFRYLGGAMRERECKRYEITYVPAAIRNRDRQIGIGEPVLSRYERVCFEKDLINIQGKPVAELICPGHPLLDAVIDLVRERNSDILKRGTILVDETDYSKNIRMLYYIENSIQDATIGIGGNRKIISKQIHFVEIDKDNNARNAGYAPYLDYRSLTKEEHNLIDEMINKLDWLKGDIEGVATTYAISNLVPKHFEEVKNKKFELVDKTISAVKERLTKEITYWDYRCEELKLQEQAGKPNARLNSEQAARRADELAGRLRKRLEELEQEKRLSPLPPVIIGGALIIPVGLINELKGIQSKEQNLFGYDTEYIEMIAMKAVINLDEKLGFIPKDVSKDNCGYDIESKVTGTGKLRFIEVKGRAKGATTVTVTKNEILTALNKPEDFILAISIIDDNKVKLYYLKNPFKYHPDFAATSVNYNIDELLKISTNVEIRELNIDEL